MGRTRVVIGFFLLWPLFVCATADRSAADETPPAPQRPENVTPPSISGAPEPGKVLTASAGTWTQSPTSYAYEWERCTEIVAQNGPDELDCSLIGGAAAATYVVTQGDRGRRLRVKVTAFRGSLAGTPAVSGPTEPVGFHLVPVATATAELQPKLLPRGRQAPAALSLGFTSSALNPPGVPQLDSISIDLSRHLSLHTAGIPSCPIRKLYTTTAAARRRCDGSVVGHGVVDSEVLLEGEEVPVEGTMTAFYDLDQGQPRILGQVMTKGSASLIYVLPFRVDRERGRYGTQLVIPQMRIIHGRIIRGGYSYSFPFGYGRISKLALSLKRSFGFAGRRRSFITASCPAQRGKVAGEFPLMKATLDYGESPYYNEPSHSTIVRTASVTGRCRVRDSGGRTRIFH